MSSNISFIWGGICNVIIVLFIYLAIKENRVSIHATMEMNLEITKLRVGDRHNGYMLYDSIYTQCLEWVTL